jgi:hypothetical protein
VVLVGILSSNSVPINHVGNLLVLSFCRITLGSGWGLLENCRRPLYWECTLPPVWKKADVVPIPKEKPIQDINRQLRPISLNPWLFCIMINDLSVKEVNDLWKYVDDSYLSESVCSDGSSITYKST